MPRLRSQAVSLGAPALRGPIACVDLETTGGTAVHHRIIEVGIVLLDGARKPGAKILEGTSIVDVCKVGGEISDTIFASYSNKQHDGFLGHSYVGEWVNIGAGCNNSDLKNNYSAVRMWCAGMARETGRPFQVWSEFRRA